MTASATISGTAIEMKNGGCQCRNTALATTSSTSVVSGSSSRFMPPRPTRTIPVPDSDLRRTRRSSSQPKPKQAATMASSAQPAGDASADS